MNRSRWSLTKQVVGAVAGLTLLVVLNGGAPVRAANGPHLVKDISPGFADSNPEFLTDLNGTLYFGAKGGSKAGKKGGIIAPNLAPSACKGK